MKRSLLSLVALTAALSWSAASLAAPPGEALAWLNRLSGAARKLNYSGTFVYQNGSLSETSRITHLVDGTNELERLEVLDGSPREVVRTNDEVKCFLPESHLLIVERRSQQRNFPALLPAGLAELADYYVIRKGATGRIAGFEGQSIVLEPRDELRYGHNFWVHSDSGLLLKATMVDDRGKTLESFAFTQLQIGGPIDRQSLRSRFDPTQAAAPPAAAWTIDRIQPQEARAEDSQWLFRNPLPGFRRLAVMKRPARPGAPESTHLVFSDGLASISVFIEALGARAEQPDIGVSTMGAVNIYSRPVGDQLVIVMGEVPLVSLKRMADGIELRKH